MKKSLALSIFAEQAAFWLLLLGVGGLAWWLGGVDFRGYYAAAVAVKQGVNPYDYSQLAPILEHITGYVGNNPYYYPPYYSLVFLPLTLVDFQIARAIWLLINLGLFIIALELSVRIVDYRNQHKWLLYIGLLLGLGTYCLRSEQTGIIMLLGLGMILWNIKHKKVIPLAVGLALIFLKPQVSWLAIIAVGFWLLTRYRRALISSIAFMIILIGLSVIAIPNWHELPVDFSGLWETNEGSTRVNATLYDYLTYQHNVTNPILIITGVIIISALIVTALWVTRNDIVPFIGIAYAGGLALTPYALQYDYVPLVLMVLWVIKEAQSNKVIIYTLLGAGGLVLIWQSWSYQGYLQLTFILIACLVVITKKFIIPPSTNSAALADEQ